MASFDDAVLGQLKALSAGQARIAPQLRVAANCAQAQALIATPDAHATQTLSEADLQNLGKKRKLLDRVCVALAARQPVSAAPVQARCKRLSPH